MKKFIKYFLILLGGFALGIISIALIFGIFIAGISTKINNTESVELAESTMLLLNISGSVSDRSTNSAADEIIGAATGQTKPLGLNEIANGLKKATKDPKVKGIFLNCGTYNGGMATADEIRNAILAFRKSGKPVIAYSGMYSELGYYIATSCSKVILNPKGAMEFDGISAKFVMYKGLFDKLGVGFQVFRVGKYKSAVEPFIQNKMSDENRAQVTIYINSLYQYQLKNIARDRRIAFDSLWMIAMNAKAELAKDALKYKLVDLLAYESDAKEDAFKQCKINVKSANSMSFVTYAKNVDPYQYSENKIAVIYAVGDIMPGTGSSEEQINSTTFIQTLRNVRDDSEIKSIVIRINSPGGSAFASDEIAHEILACKKVKPVIVSFGNVSASGGYYMGCVADSIFASPNTITGSIGVFALLPNSQELFGEKLGLNYETVELGIMSAGGWRPDRALNNTEQKTLQNVINSIYDDFITIVSMGRKIPKQTVENIAQGRVYTGIDAKSLGLVDDLGGLDRALLSASRKAKIKDFRVVNYPEEKDWISQLLQTDDLAQTKWKSLAKFSGLPIETIKQAERIQQLIGPQYLLPWSVNLH